MNIINCIEMKSNAALLSFILRYSEVSDGQCKMTGREVGRFGGFAQYELRGFLLKKIIPKKNSPGIPGHCFGVIRSY
jgi:hypothetical protein